MTSKEDFAWLHELYAGENEQTIREAEQSFRDLINTVADMETDQLDRLEGALTESENLDNVKE